ncbi:MAG: hypothetical protein QOD25_1581 [Alphaproteobacteria bacterium]|jgi:hypothetical protein|nr:hypothetical protein [Alphaproteobacteria bacterium]
MGASDTAMLVPSSYRRAVTPCVKYFTEFEIEMAALLPAIAALYGLR